MNLAQLNNWFPGEIDQRSLHLAWLADEFQKFLPDTYEVMSPSYNDLECMWLTVKFNGRRQTIPVECVREIISGSISIDLWFEVN